MPPSASAMASLTGLFNTVMGVDAKVSKESVASIVATQIIVRFIIFFGLCFILCFGCKGMAIPEVAQSPKVGNCARGR